MKVPSISEFYETVDAIPSKKERYVVKAIYLTASRPSEFITKVSPWETSHEVTKPLGKHKIGDQVSSTKPYGRFMKFSIQDYKYKNSSGEAKVEKALVIIEAVAKRKPKKKAKEGEDNNVYKAIALPTTERFSPWTKDLVEHLQQYGKLSIDMTRSGVGYIVKKALFDLDPNISPRSLRSYRITHLNKYGFTPFDTILYVGWSMRYGFGQLGMPVGNLEYYLFNAWQSYFPKLMQSLGGIIQN